MWQYIRKISAAEEEREPHHYLNNLLLPFRGHFKELVEAQSEDVRQILDEIFDGRLAAIIASEDNSKHFLNVLRPTEAN